MTRLAWPVRAWIVAEIAFGAVGASAVLIAPQHAPENFAWPLRPAVGAAVIGAFYGSVAVMLGVALFARTWERVRAVVVAAAALTSMMLLATVMHWREFSVDTPAFAVWLVSYVVPPPTLVVLYLWQQRRAVPYGADVTEALPSWWRHTLLAGAAAHIIVWSALFLVPAALTAVDPWRMSPLFVRVLAGWFVGYAVLLWLMGRENDWRRAQTGVVWLAALPVFLAVQLSRFAEQVDWRNPWLLVTLAHIGLLGATGALLWARRRVASRHLAALAVAGIGTFLVVLAVIPALRPDLDVRARWVGEYARGGFGWMMTGAYVALGVGALALSVALADAVSTRRLGLSGRTLLVLAGLGAFSAALLPQNPTDGSPGTPAGTLRDLLLVPTFVSLLGALALVALALRSHPAWRGTGTAVGCGAMVVVLALVVSFAVPDAWRGLAGRYFDATWAMLLLGLAAKVAATRAATRAATSETPLASGGE